MTTSPHNDPIVNILGPLDGDQLPGGCDSCEAYETVEPSTAGVWKLVIHHDDACPVLARVRNAQ